MKYSLFTFLILSFMIASCNKSIQSHSGKDDHSNEKSKAYELVYKMVQKVGNYKTLSKKKDVVYSYSYQTPDGKADVSTEKYLFDGELSYGLYNKHERTFPELQGSFDQGFDGSEFWLRHNGEIINDTNKLKRVAFTRPTNFYWFTMFQKMLDPGLNYEYIGERKNGGNVYDVVKVSFNLNKKPTDIYQLYINQETGIVDQFLFTVADFGVIEVPYLMILEYEHIDGLMIPTKRKYKKSNWEAAITDDPWILVTWSDIKFDNGLTIDSFKK